MSAATLETTGVVLIVKVAVELPPGIVTDAGAVVLGSLDDRATETPLGGAGDFSVSVAVADAPPTTDVGVIVICIGGTTSMSTDFEGMPLVTT
jgi:hypothetical protein